MNGESNRAQFGVHGVEDDGALTLVVGRCYRGSLRRGDLFSEVERPGEALRSIGMTIVRMEMYNRTVDEIDEGLTAKLTLNGEGRDALGEGCVLLARVAPPS